MNVAARLGNEAESPLAHTCATIEQQCPSLPDPGHLERLMIDHDRPTPVLRNPPHLHKHGRLRTRPRTTWSVARRTTHRHRNTIPAHATVDGS